MSSSEIAFLAVGLVIGAAVGAALVEAIRARPAPRRHVRVTISPNSVNGRRSSTLANPTVAADRRPIPGSPDDGARPEAPIPATGDDAPPNRTRVPSPPVRVPARAVGVPVVRDPRVAAPGGPMDVGHVTQGGSPGSQGSPSSSPSTRVNSQLLRTAQPAGRAGVADPVSPLTLAERGGVGVAERVAAPAARPATVPPLAFTLDIGEPVRGLGVRPRSPAADPRPSLAIGAIPVVVATDAHPDVADPTGGGFVAADVPSVEPCDTQRRLVDERCTLSDVAGMNARTAADALRAAQRAYDVLRDEVDRAQAVADPREIAAAKQELHRRFRSASDAAGGADETEAAARDWLSAINELNGRVRDAARFLDKGTEDLRSAIPRLDRLTLEADAARITAETADAGCREARERLAACEEAGAQGADTPPAPTGGDDPHPFDALWPGETDATRSHQAPPAEPRSAVPLVLRMLRGDRAARDRLVASMAGSEPDEVAAWQLRLTALMDAIAARAIEDGYLDLPEEHRFWGLFELRERREIVGALSALGYRFDGLGGFADGRVPTARDLSLAVGYAGLDRMRIRGWPQEAELASLYEDAAVAADDWLVDQADDLALGPMVDALGSRASELADLWNAWGRLRPALLSSG